MPDIPTPIVTTNPTDVFARFRRLIVEQGADGSYAVTIQYVEIERRGGLEVGSRFLESLQIDNAALMANATVLAVMPGIQTFCRDQQAAVTPQYFATS